MKSDVKFQLRIFDAKTYIAHSGQLGAWVLSTLLRRLLKHKRDVNDDANVHGRVTTASPSDAGVRVPGLDSEAEGLKLAQFKST